MLSGPPVTVTLSAAQWLDRFLAGSNRQRRTLLSGPQPELTELTARIPERLTALDATGDDWAAGCLIQTLLAHGGEQERAEFRARHPEGWLAVNSVAGLSFTALQEALANQAFEDADRITSALLRELAGPAAEQRGYVYYSEVPGMSGLDLQSLDRLWLVYSQGRFGFTVQARLLKACQGRWELLWPKLGWKSAGVWTRYPGSFQWTLKAPEGHMPLINQLRGVRLMDALLSHPALQQRMAA
ncbi:MAG: GUN4 domain-containing protein [Cyanobacteriota bacterium]